MKSIVEKLQNLVTQNLSGKVSPEEFQKQMQEVSEDLAIVFEKQGDAAAEGTDGDNYDIATILDGVDPEGLVDAVLSNEESFDDDVECESCKI